MSKITAVQIADELRGKILSGSLAGGVQLKQEQLAQYFGVSRIPVREALSRLVAEGLVVHEIYKGATVATASLDEISEAMDIRIALETRALKLALPRMTRSMLDRSERLLDRYDRVATPQEWTKLNLEFHLSLYQPANRPRLYAMIENVVTGLDRHVRAYISFTVGRDNPQEDHYAILEACRRQDEARAVELLERHIAATQAALAAAGAKVGRSARRGRAAAGAR